MKTTSKKYKIRLYFSEPVPTIAESGILEHSISAKSPQGAEKIARKQAEICSPVGNVTHGEIEYKTKAGVQIRKFEI